MSSNKESRAKLSRRFQTIPDGTCTLRIRSHYNSLSPIHKKLANFITANREMIPAFDLRQLAKRARVSSATVTRFCRAIGFASFHQFKMASAQEMASVPLIFDDFDTLDSDETRINKVFAAYIQSLIDTRAMVPVEGLTEATDRIVQAKNVGLFGSGTSGAIAVAASHRFSLLGVHCHAYTDPYEQIIGATLLTKGDVAIGISHSGASRITVDALRLARKRGAFIVAITNYANSPLTQTASLSLMTSSHEKSIHVATLTSRVAQLTLIDCLYITLAARNEKNFTERTALIDKELREALREFPDARR